MGRGRRLARLRAGLANDTWPSMATQVNIGEAKTRLSELVAAVERGEEVTLARAGVPVVRLERVASGAAREALGRKRAAAMGFARHLAGDADLSAGALRADRVDGDAAWDAKLARVRRAD